MSLHTTHETVLRRKQTHLAPFQTDSYMSERDLRSRSDLNEAELDKYSAFDTLSKAKKNIARLEENKVTPSAPVAVAVVRPRATATAVRPRATATAVRPRATATAVRPSAATAVHPSPPEIPTVRSDRDNMGDDACQAAASGVQVAAAAICLTVM